MAIAHPCINEVRNGLILCVRCEKWKNPDKFQLAPRMKRGRHSWCRRCQREMTAKRYEALPPEQREKEKTRRLTVNAASARRRRKEDPGRERAYGLKYRYGITIDKFNETLRKQQGLCAMGCGSSATHTDHDHSCCPGKKGCGRCFRGILCHPCNIMLGLARDDKDRLAAGIAYLETWERLKDVHVSNGSR